MPGGLPNFGNLAIIAFHGFRPMALRPRLSPGLPFSIYCFVSTSGVIMLRPVLRMRIMASLSSNKNRTWVPKIPISTYSNNN